MGGGCCGTGSGGTYRARTGPTGSNKDGAGPARHALGGLGGNDIPTTLVFAAAGCGTAPDLAKAVSCATAVELTHLSSLVHDDLMDDADSHGGVQTLHKSKGLEAAFSAVTT